MPKKPKKKNPATSYGDVRPIMESAAESMRGVRYRLSSFGAAINFRMRCYMFRRAAQDLAAEQLGPVPGIAASTPYDSLSISIEDQHGCSWNRRPENLQEHPYFDVVLRHNAPKGQLLDADGNEIALDFEGPENTVEPVGSGLDLDFEDG